jgi:hypothetical protein
MLVEAASLLVVVSCVLMVDPEIRCVVVWIGAARAVARRAGICSPFTKLV